MDPFQPATDPFAPFAWREALTPQHVSPAVSARSNCSGISRQNTPGSTPRSTTPPGGNSARSSRSNTSARSGPLSRCGSSAGLGGAYGSSYDGGLSARTSSYMTPEPSARSSDYLSVQGGNTPPSLSARYDFGTVHEDYSHPPPGEPARKVKTRASANAAFASFTSGAQLPPAPQTPPPLASFSDMNVGYYDDGLSTPVACLPPQPSLDPRVVYSAARHGKHKDVESELVAGFDPRYADNYGNTLFHVACQNGNKRISKACIKYGGDMDAQNHKGHTGLHFLFAYGYPDIADYFIEKGANDYIQNASGNTAREGIR